MSTRPFPFFLFVSLHGRQAQTSRVRRLVRVATLAAALGVILPPAAQQLWAQEGLPRALELYRSGDCRAAETIFKEILRKEPSNVTIRKMLADCLTQDNRLEDARQEYQRIIKLAPGDADARRILTPEPPPPALPKPAAPKGPSEVMERVRTGGRSSAPSVRRRPAG